VQKVTGAILLSRRFCLCSNSRSAVVKNLEFGDSAAFKSESHLLLKLSESLYSSIRWHTSKPDFNALRATAKFRRQRQKQGQGQKQGRVSSMADVASSNQE
jgi:hypothetical protein